MNGARSSRIGPHSRVLARGSIGDLVHGNSREGRFLRAYERQLLDHVGGEASIVQRAIIARASRLALQLDLLDAKSLKSGLTDHDMRAYSAWHRGLVNTLKALGIKAHAQQQRGPTLAEAAAEGRREREEGRFAA